MENIEIWKPVKNYEGLYEVSSFGRIKSINYGKEKIRKFAVREKGYFNLSLSKNCIVKNRNVHQLVAEAFLNHKPCGMTLVVNHIDFNKQNNNVSNLEIITNKENTNQKHIVKKSVISIPNLIETN